MGKARHRPTGAHPRGAYIGTIRISVWPGRARAIANSNAADALSEKSVAHRMLFRADGSRVSGNVPSLPLPGAPARGHTRRQGRHRMDATSDVAPRRAPSEAEPAAAAAATAIAQSSRCRGGTWTRTTSGGVWMTTAETVTVAPLTHAGDHGRRRLSVAARAALARVSVASAIARACSTPPLPRLRS